MKKAISILLSIVVCICFSACDGQKVLQTSSQPESIPEQTDIEDNSFTVSESTQTSGTNDDTTERSERKVKLIIEDAEISIILYETPAANSLYETLPLELAFEDFNATEKISYLPDKLSTEGEPDGCDPDVGDFCLYAPWGNLSIFYKDFRYSDSLILLGHIDSGIDIIGSMEGDFSARLEKAN